MLQDASQAKEGCTCSSPQHKVPRHGSTHPETKKATQVWPALSKTVCWHIADMHMKIHLGLATDASSSAVQWTALFISWERSKK